MAESNPQIELDYPIKDELSQDWQKGEPSWEFRSDKFKGLRVQHSKVADTYDELSQKIDDGTEEVARRILEQFKFNIKNEAFASGELLAGAGMMKVAMMEYRVYNDAPHFIWIEFGREPSKEVSWEMYERIKEWVRLKGVRMVKQYRKEAKFRRWGRERIGQPSPKMYKGWSTPSMVKDIDKTIRAKYSDLKRVGRNSQAGRAMLSEIKTYRVYKAQHIDTNSAEERELNETVWRIMKSLGDRSWNRDGLHLLENAINSVAPEAEDIIASYVEG